MRLNLLAYLVAGCLFFALTACGGGSGTAISAIPATPAPDPVSAPVLSLAARFGEKLFHDPQLSGSGRMSCASCHDPAFAHGPANTMPVQVGGQFETEFGLRAAPSLRYLERQPAFTLGNGQHGQANGLSGGLLADGRVNTLAEQARLPLFNRLEMDNQDLPSLIRNVKNGSAGALFAELARERGNPNPNDEAALLLVQQALQAFQLEQRQFHPYNSKYDRFLAGQATLSAPEQRGLAAFLDPARGNCAACHPASSNDGRPPLFTNFSYAATGVPRNDAIFANADPAYFDLGLCGSLRTDLNEPRYCGLFRTPSLRNAANRPVFFHNGSMTSLTQVMQFYNTRDTRPELWYPNRGGVAVPDPNWPQFGLVKQRFVGGTVQKFDDLPPMLHGNISPIAPLDGRTPAMTDQDMANIVCFLHTLSDADLALPIQPACAG